MMMFGICLIGMCYDDKGEEPCRVVGPDHMYQFRIFRYSFWVAALDMLTSDPKLARRHVQYRTRLRKFR